MLGKQLLDGPDEDNIIQGFFQECICPRLACAVFGGQYAENEDGNAPCRRIALERTADTQPITAGEHNLREEYIWQEPTRLFECLLAVIGELHTVARFFQKVLFKLSDMRIPLHSKDQYLTNCMVLGQCNTTS